VSALARRVAFTAAFTVASLASVASLDRGPTFADSNQLTGTATGPTTAGGNSDLWRSNTRKAFESQGSSCPWTYIGAYFDPSIPPSALHNVSDQGNAGRLRIFIDCTNEPRGVLEPTPTEMAAFAWERARTAIPTASVKMQLTDNVAAFVNVDTAYWLEGRYPVLVSASLASTSTTITLRPVRITTNWGDGNTSVCETPLPLKPTAACTYRFRQPSTTQSNKAFAVSHDILWSATWASRSGESGSFESVVRQSSSEVKVIPFETHITANKWASGVFDADTHADVRTAERG
jgi:hypothetical protein